MWPLMSVSYQHSRKSYVLNYNFQSRLVFRMHSMHTSPPSCSSRSLAFTVITAQSSITPETDPRAYLWPRVWLSINKSTSWSRRERERERNRGDWFMQSRARIEEAKYNTPQCSLVAVKMSQYNKTLYCDIFSATRLWRHWFFFCLTL